jgi:hypothetical protein
MFNILSLLSGQGFSAIITHGLPALLSVLGYFFLAACDPIDAFRYATEGLGPDVGRTASYRSIWLNLNPVGMYPKNKGTVQSVFSIGNVEPTDDSGAWDAIDLSGIGTNTNLDTPAEVCTNDWDDVSWGFDEANYGPERKQLRGPVVCKKDLEFSHDPDTFLSGYVQEIAKRAKREIELNLEAHHIRLSAKAIAVADFEGSITEQESINGIDCADCELTQEMLEIVAAHLIDNGATTPDSNGFIEWSDNGPIFPLYISMQQSQRILRQNSELRQDYRYADPNTLIARIGANRIIGNFRHIINLKPRRYTCSGGTYTLVPRFKTAIGGDAPTKGTKQIPNNPDWYTAPYEGVDVLSPNLFTREIVAPVNSAGGVSFDPTNYMGEWQFVRGAYKWSTSCDDPLEEQGRHYAQFAHAIKPSLPARFKYGFHIIQKRCVGNDVECTTCSS